MCSWWDVSQALAEGTSMVPSCLWLIRDRWTVTSPKVVLKVNGRVPRHGCRRRLCRGGSAGPAPGRPSR